MSADGQQAPSGPTRVYRTLPSRVLGWTLVVLAVAGGTVLTLADGIRGWGVLGPISAMTVVAAVVWMALLRPCVEVGPDRVVLRNLLTDVEVPFARLAEVTHVWALELTDTAGTKHSAWAVPVRRDLRLAGRVDRYAESTTRGRAHRGVHAEVLAGEVEEAWQSWRRAGGRTLQGPALPRTFAAASVLPLAVALALILLSLIS